MKLIAKNKKAYFDYDIMDSQEAGIELKWHEVKSIRSGQVNLKGSYIVSRNGELYVKSMHISAWKALTNRETIDTDRERKIFLPKKKITSFSTKLKESWYAITPLELYFRWSLIKMSVWLVKWKKLHQKKQLLKERTLDKEAKMHLKKNY